MRRRIAPLVVLAAFLPGLAAAQEPAPLDEPPVVGAPAQGDQQLDRLFERLAAAESEAEARGVAALIQRRWTRSGSDTADLLMQRAGRAIQGRDPALAIELIDRILALEPGWAEAWNRRAAAFMMLDDPVAAIADIHRAVSLEPRHFAAWAGLGSLLMQSGDAAGALGAFERALAAHPRQPRLEAIVRKLERDVEGVDL